LIGPMNDLGSGDSDRRSLKISNECSLTV
jgi:hypothetical protein